MDTEKMEKNQTPSTQSTMISQTPMKNISNPPQQQPQTFTSKTSVNNEYINADANVEHLNSANLFSEIVQMNQTTSKNLPNNNAVSLNSFSTPSTSSFSHPRNPFKKPNYSDDDIKTPKKDQGLIIESIDGLKIKQYLEAIGEIVGPSNILYASRLSRDRICMYLKTKDLVNEIANKTDFITIDTHDLSIRPLLMRASKFYLNRVCPSIPSSILHDKILEMGINIT